ncbi:MAG: NAD(P)-dependent oxidoreductase [Prolixibacteraceae bacterium]|nr:NAD(P)-dependent oxidoreductase [Prolixibacteraceae bacterium]
MKVFVTGGTGFIGSHVVKALVDNNHSVVVLARNIEKVPALAELQGVKIVEGDISVPASWKEWLDNTDVLIHIALNWGDSAVEMLMHDTLSSVRLFEMAAKAGVKHIVYTSSTAVNDWVYMDESARELGDNATVYSHTKQNPVTYYGATKGASELYLQAVAFEHSIRANIIRPGYTFGNPAVDGAGIEADDRFSQIVKCAKQGNAVEVIKNDGTQFIDASDLAKIYIAVTHSKVNGNMYFGLGNRFITWEEIANEAMKMTGSKSELIVIEKGWPSKPALFDVEDIKHDFNLSFDSWDKICRHLRYLIMK